MNTRPPLDITKPIRRARDGARARFLGCINGTGNLCYALAVETEEEGRTVEELAACTADGGRGSDGTSYKWAFENVPDTLETPVGSITRFDSRSIEGDHAQYEHEDTEVFDLTKIKDPVLRHILSNMLQRVAGVERIVARMRQSNGG